MQWLFVLAALLTSIWVLLQMGLYFDKDDDPNIRALKSLLGRRLAGRETANLTAQVQQTSQAFFALFERLFGGQGTLLERGIWTGLLFSPAMLLLIRTALLVAPGEARPQTADLLLLAIVLAILLTLAAILGYLMDRRIHFLVLGGVLVGVLYGVLGGVLYGILGSVLYGVHYGVSVGVLYGVLVGVLVGVLGGGRYGVLYGVLYGILVGALGVVVYGVLYGILYGVSVGVGVLLGWAGMRLIQTPFPVHPLRALASSLGFIFLVGLIRLDDAQGFLNAAQESGLKSLAFVAFNLFADGVSLLETRWVIQRALHASIPRLAGLLLFDLVASALIFLTLPALLGELPDFLRGFLFQGQRPWLGIFFWTTFSTSLIFYAFVAAVFLFVLPGHGLARAFHRLIGGVVTVEERPFTAVFMAMSLVVLGVVIGGGIYGLLGG